MKKAIIKNTTKWWKLLLKRKIFKVAKKKLQTEEQRQSQHTHSWKNYKLKYSKATSLKKGIKTVKLEFHNKNICHNKKAKNILQKLKEIITSTTRNVKGSHSDRKKMKSDRNLS